MTWIALKMLTGNRAKYYAIIFGISFACMLMTQQSSIFVGLMRNTSSQIRDIQGADVWVMDPSVQFIEDVTPLTENDLYRVRGVPGVKWAVVLFKSMATAQIDERPFQEFQRDRPGRPDAGRRPGGDADRLGRRLAAPRRRDPRRARLPVPLSRRTAARRLDGRDERPPGGGRRHLQKLAEFSDLPGRLYAVQPSDLLRPAGAALPVVHPGAGRAGRAGRRGVRPHPEADGADGPVGFRLHVADDRLLHAAHRHSDQLRHHGAARFHHRRGHRRPDVSTCSRWTTSSSSAPSRRWA